MEKRKRSGLVPAMKTAATMWEGGSRKHSIKLLLGVALTLPAIYLSAILSPGDSMLYNNDLMMLVNTPRATSSNLNRLDVDSRSSSSKHTQNDGTLKIAWLMSFPNSGTHFTIEHVRSLSSRHTATNYPYEEVIESDAPLPAILPIAQDQPKGPFWFEHTNYPQYKYPQKYALVKTHCGGRCLDCDPSLSLMPIYYFKITCLTTELLKNHKRLSAKVVPRFSRVPYSMDRVEKAIHLVRDPFDNVVSRFHHERKKSHNTQLKKEYNNTRDNFRRYCLDLNEKYNDEERNFPALKHTGKPNIVDLMENIPCRMDFIRWVEWHNHAFTLTQDEGVETLVVHYSEYENDMAGVSRRLLDFLELSADGTPAKFMPGKVYRDYFTVEEQRIVGQALTRMATRRTWQEISRYVTEHETSSMTR